jgi:5-hydroxyisourate hydrolase
MANASAARADDCCNTLGSLVYNSLALSAITTHVLDTARGRPAAGVPVVLERGGGHGGVGQWHIIGHGETDADGRLRTLMSADQPLVPGLYRLVFDTHRYFESLGIDSLYPSVILIFRTAPGQAHYHLPLLLAPFGYTTYRGS